MTTTDRIAVAGFVVTALGVAIAVIAGFWSPLVGSVAGVVIGVLAWIIWVSLSLARLATAVARLSKTVEAARASTISSTVVQPPLGQEPYQRFMNKAIVTVDAEHRTLKVPSRFLGFAKLTILFWVEVSEEIFRTQTNRYLLAYSTNPVSPYPNAFWLCVKERSAEWELVVKGSDPTKQARITFSSGHQLLGWRLFTIRWDSAKGRLDLRVGPDRAVEKEMLIAPGGWPSADPNWEFHVGGWQRPSPAMLSGLRFYDFRVFDKCLGDGELRALLQQEQQIIAQLDTSIAV